MGTPNLIPTSSGAAELVESTAVAPPPGTVIASAPPPPAALSFTGYQKFVVAMLAFLQFTIIIDFMMLSPLGAMVMPALKITPSQFGLVVSAYAFSAGASGLLASGFADRFDRKKLLLFFYVGFVLGTLLCALAHTFEFLLAARIVTGLFGGVIGSIAFAIITDLFPLQMRGRVMGFVQTSFAASQVLGIPMALALSARWGWQAPFYLVVGISAVVGVAIFAFLRPIDGHLTLQRSGNPFAHVLNTVANRRHLQGFALGALLATGGFMLMPFGSAYSVHNLGVSMDDLPTVYLFTGICTLVAGPLMGKFNDTFGAQKTFLGGSILMIAMVLIYTNLPVVPLWFLVLINSLMFIGITARMISSQTVSSAIPQPEHRGSYMSVAASVAQFSGGAAAALAGLIVSEAADGKIMHFEIIGCVVVAASIVTLFQMRKLGPTPKLMPTTARKEN